MATGTQEQPPTQHADIRAMGDDSIVTQLRDIANHGDVYISSGRSTGKGYRRLRFGGTVPNDELVILQEYYAYRELDRRLNGILRSRRICVLSGRRGSGRQTAALVALGDVSNAKVFHLESSASLADVRLTKGHGHLYDAGDERPAEAELRELRDRLDKAEGWLVVLVAADMQVTQGSATALAWTTPALEELVEASKLAPAPSLEELRDTLGEAPTVASIVDLLGQIRAARAEGTPDAEVLDAHPERQRERIRSWFAQDQSVDELLMRTALASMSGVPQGAFYDCQERLYQLFRQRVPEADAATRAQNEERRVLTSQNSLLSRCGGTVRYASIGAPGRTARRLVIELVEPQLKDIYFEELWQHISPSLRAIVLIALYEFASLQDDQSLQRLAETAASLVRIDLDEGLHLIDELASSPELRANSVAAASLAILADSDFDAPLVADIARDLAYAPHANRAFTGILALAGRVGTIDLRLAIRVHRRSQLPWQARKVTWRLLTETCTHSAVLSKRLIELVLELETVRKLQTRDVAFDLLAEWFALPNNRALRAPVLQLARHTSATEKLVARLLAHVMSGSNGYIAWYQPIIAAMTSADRDAQRSAARLIVGSLSTLPLQRRLRLLNMIDEFCRTWRDGSQLSERAYQRALAVLDVVRERKLNDDE